MSTSLAPAQIAIAHALIRRDTKRRHRRDKPEKLRDTGSRPANNAAIESAARHSTDPEMEADRG
jgi:hypothetical protein